MRDSAAFVTPDATTGKRLLSRHLENASIFAALYEQVTSTLTLIRSLTLTPTLTPTPTLTLYAQRARHLVLPAVAGAAPTVAPCTPSKRFHFCMACRCACTESACACTRMRMCMYMCMCSPWEVHSLVCPPWKYMHACVFLHAAARVSSVRATWPRWRTCRRSLGLGKRWQRPALPRSLWRAPHTPAALRKPRTKRHGKGAHCGEGTRRIR